MENVEAIALDLEEPNITPLSVDALSNMINLRLLRLRNVKFSGALDNLPSELRHVSWYQYPFTTLPSSFQSNTLVQLIMPESNMTEVWKEKMVCQFSSFYLIFNTICLIYSYTLYILPFTDAP